MKQQHFKAFRASPKRLERNLNYSASNTKKNMSFSNVENIPVSDGQENRSFATKQSRQLRVTTNEPRKKRAVPSTDEMGISKMAPSVGMLTDSTYFESRQSDLSNSKKKKSSDSDIVENEGDLPFPTSPPWNYKGPTNMDDSETSISLSSSGFLFGEPPPSYFHVSKQPDFLRPIDWDSLQLTSNDNSANSPVRMVCNGALEYAPCSTWRDENTDMKNAKLVFLYERHVESEQSIAWEMDLMNTPELLSPPATPVHSQSIFSFRNA